jgi:hypothetical protein
MSLQTCPNRHTPTTPPAHPNTTITSGVNAPASPAGSYRSSNSSGTPASQRQRPTSNSSPARHPTLRAWRTHSPSTTATLPSTHHAAAAREPTTSLRSTSAPPCRAAHSVSPGPTASSTSHTQGPARGGVSVDDTPAIYPVLRRPREPPGAEGR